MGVHLCQSILAMTQMEDCGRIEKRLIQIEFRAMKDRSPIVSGFADILVFHALFLVPLFLLLWYIDGAGVYFVSDCTYSPTDVCTPCPSPFV
ncbi:hypothetical protein EJB05_24407 [Eragrostis curvula]|uniref:Uncharacterized protein n=1 Tax=Eragrostis curvula TaxID=38414 RepID=A0A5J9V9K2_9POAL|nr:hypothetical protein EJB05_24407 [Eragrostis curvula]